MTSAVADLLAIADPIEPLAPGREAPQVLQLVDAARAGDQAAFGDLIGLYQRVVLRTAMAALGSREDAEDAAQEAFVMAWRKLSGFRGQSTFRTWLLAIVWRKALDRRRVRAIWWRRTEWNARPDRDILAELTAEALDPEQRLATQAFAGRIRAEILRLPGKLRDTLLLAASGEHSYDEISAILRVPLGTVKWRVSAARRAIADRLNASSSGDGITS